MNNFHKKNALIGASLRKYLLLGGRADDELVRLWQKAVLMKFRQVGLLQGGVHPVTLTLLEVRGSRRCASRCGLLPLQIGSARCSSISSSGFPFGAIAAVAKQGARKAWAQKAMEASARRKTRQGRHAKENGK